MRYVQFIAGVAIGLLVEGVAGAFPFGPPPGPPPMPSGGPPGLPSGGFPGGGFPGGGDAGVGVRRFVIGEGQGLAELLERGCPDMGRGHLGIGGNGRHGERGKKERTDHR